MNPKIQTPLIKLFQLKTKTIKATFNLIKRMLDLKQSHFGHMLIALKMSSKIAHMSSTMA